MSQPTNTKLMDTSPGGESTNQYEEASIYTTPNTEQKPNFGDSIPPRHAALAAQQETARQRTERHDTNKRYGESISEHGFGGTTTGSSHTTTSSRTSPVTGTGISGGGDAAEVAREEQKQKQQRQGSYETSPEVEEREKRDRRRQGYGEGSGVGG